MSNFLEQLEQIKSLILSTEKSDKSSGYSILQHLQEQCSSDDSLIQPLVDSAQTLISLIIEDIQVDNADEEISSLALKCLGFMLYHPSLVAAIQKQYVDQVLESLVRLITMTKIKLVCNLGVWCISIQQLDGSYLASHFDSLLRAIVHALDNPVGSLSTTFEALQAVMKLATQSGEKMRGTSSIWMPPIYRRLLSADKREREMCLRCLLQINSLILPPPLSLSKAIAQDMKLKLLPGMNELLKHGKKVQALQAWGWFIRILGSYSLKTRHVVNEMLKVPELTFSDQDPQVQIASQVAWEGLIEVLVFLPPKACGHVTTHQHQVEEDKVKSMDTSGGYSKRLKLIMTPLIGIMTSKADLSVQLSCLNTWCFLLHKLDRLVNDPHILGTVVEPMFKVVFNIGLDKNIMIWNFCINQLHDFVNSKSTSVNYGTHNQVNSGSSCSLKNYPIKWLPWDCSQIDFLVRMIQLIFTQAVMATPCCEKKRLICDDLLRIFRSFLKGVQMDFSKSSTAYNTTMESMNSILMFVKVVYEATNDSHITCLQFVEAIIQELDHSILGSPLYKVALDLNYIFNLQYSCEDKSNMLIGISPLSLADMVPPMVYLTVLYFSAVIRLSYKSFSIGSTLQEAYNNLVNMLSSYDSLEILHAIVTLLTLCRDENSLKVWIIVARGLRDYIDGVKTVLPLKIQSSSTGGLTVCYLLIYPVIVSSSLKPLSIPNLTFEEVTEMWRSLYRVINSTHLQKFPRTNGFAEDLCSSLNGFLDQRTNASEGILENHLLSLCGDIAACILENLDIEKVTPEAIKSDCTRSSGLNNFLEFMARLMKLMWIRKGDALVTSVMSRLFCSLTQVVGCLQWREDIMSLIKVLCDPLVPWLSEENIRDKSTNCHLQPLWTEILGSLQRSWPAIVFDSSFLKLLAPLLEKTLDHPSLSVSQPTIVFWNSTYGDQIDLDFPSCLLQVLDKLSRLGKVKINKMSLYEVTSTLNVCSKRVEFSKTTMDSVSCKNKFPPYPKRKRLELTEHQKEVRRAQQGKMRDCSGHGPGIRTYTSVDFSQANEDSQDSQDIRDPELILELLRRTD